MKMKLIMCVTMLAFLSVLNVKNVVAETVPVLIHEYNDINVFDACAYYRISDFSTLKNFSENTLYTHSKNEVTGSVKNGLWEYEYVDPYIVQVVDKITPYTIKECVEDNKTMKIECKDVIHHNITYKQETRYKSSWLDADKLLADSIKLSDIRLKSTQKVRFCADIERVWTPEGFTIKVDVIPQFNGFIYYSYVWFDNSFEFKMPILGFCTHCSTDEEMLLLVNNDTSNMGVFINGSLELFWGNFTVNSTWKIIGYIYFNDFTDYVLVDPTETFQIDTFIDEGNSTDFGSPEIQLEVRFHLNGTDLYDSSLYGRHGIGLSGATSTPGQIGKGLDFSGTNQFFEIDNVWDTYQPVNATIMFWARPDALTTDIIGKWNSVATHLRVEIGAAGTIGFISKISNAIKINTASAPGSLSTGSWQLVTIVIDTGIFNGVLMYVNGVPVSVTNSTWSVPVLIGGFNNNWRVGERGDGVQDYNGQMDEIRIYNRTLSSDEILMIFNDTAGIHNVTDIGDIEIRPPLPPPPPIPIHSFIIYKLISPPIPFIGWFLETLTFKAVILFMDRLTVTGNADIGENLNVTGNWSGNDFYGEMWFHNDLSNVTTTINTQGVYVNVTGFDTGELTGQTLNGFSYFTDTLVAQVAGKYKADCTLSFGNVGNNQEYQMHIAINDIHQNQTDTHRKIGAAGDVGNVGCSGFIDIEVGDQINLHIRNNDGTGNVVSHASNVNLIRIGD